MHYRELQSALRSAPRTWLVTGAAGFIGSNILQTLLQLDQYVLALDADLQVGKGALRLVAERDQLAYLVLVAGTSGKRSGGSLPTGHAALPAAPAAGGRV